MVPSNRCHIENQKTIFVIWQRQLSTDRIRQDTALDTECSPAEQDLRQNVKLDIRVVKFFLPFDENWRRTFSHVQSGLT